MPHSSYLKDMSLRVLLSGILTFELLFYYIAIIRLFDIFVQVHLEIQELQDLVATQASQALEGLLAALDLRDLQDLVEM